MLALSYDGGGGPEIWWSNRGVWLGGGRAVADLLSFLPLAVFACLPICRAVPSSWLCGGGGGIVVLLCVSLAFKARACEEGEYRKGQGWDTGVGRLRRRHHPKALKNNSFSETGCAYNHIPFRATSGVLISQSHRHQGGSAEGGTKQGGPKGRGPCESRPANTAADGIEVRPGSGGSTRRHSPEPPGEAPAPELPARCLTFLARKRCGQEEKRRNAEISF